MLRFFSKIRYHLASENKVGKYLRYAVGEILLVVIGILIALSINNWNEENKDKKKESYHLREIEENLHLIINKLNEDNDYDSLTVVSVNIVLSTIKNKAPYNETLNWHFHRCRFTPMDANIPNASYLELQNAGFNLIQSETVRNEIINLFEVTYPNLESVIIKISNIFINPFAQEFAYENFETMASGVISAGGVIPNDYSQLITNQNYINLVSTIKGYTNWFIINRKQSITETKRVLKVIQDELSQKSD